MRTNNRMKFASTTTSVEASRNPTSPPIIVNPYDLGAIEDGNVLNWECHEPERYLGLSFREHRYKAIPWHPDVGRIGNVMALDSETELSKSGMVPRFVIGQVFAGGEFVYFLQHRHLKDFLTLHGDSKFIIHNAPFDLAVCVQETGLDLYEMVEREQVVDTGLLYQLVTLATEEFDYKYSLEHVADKLFSAKLPKDDSIRLTFGKFRQDQTVFYTKISEQHLRYAALDAVSTFEIYGELMKKVEEIQPRNFLTHQIQLMGAIVLHHISLRGIGFDEVEKRRFQSIVEEAFRAAEAELKTFGYEPHGEGSSTMFEKILTDTFPDIALQLPRTTKTNQISKTGDDLSDFRKSCKFIDAYLEYKSCEKLLSSFLKNLKGNRIHTKFNPMVATGRTSSYDPCLQNLPRTEGIRECFVPKPGHVFMIVDYSQIELCTLAQTNLAWHGESRMAELINQGVDLHRWFASVVSSIEESKISPDARKNAKACNFGFPGGLGLETFADYAYQTYGIENMTMERADELKKKWLAAFPEMKKYLYDGLIYRHKFARSHPTITDPEIAYAVFKRIIGGATHTKGSVSKQPRRYARNELFWAFNTVMRDFAPNYIGYDEGSPELKGKVLRGSVSTITGRIRFNATFCQRKNGPFQGLAADGAKIAMWLMWRAGLPIVHFIHDEFILEIPETTETLQLAEKVNELMIAGMQKVVPDVAIRTEWVLSDRWFKGGEYPKNALGNSEFKGVMTGWKKELVGGKGEKIPDFRPLKT